MIDQLSCERALKLDTKNEDQHESENHTVSSNTPSSMQFKWKPDLQQRERGASQSGSKGPVPAILSTVARRLTLLATHELDLRNKSIMEAQNTQSTLYKNTAS